MADQEKKALDTSNLDVTELEDQDLEGAAGGGVAGAELTDVSNSGCPTTINNGC
jgi:hypothetical protein